MENPEELKEKLVIGAKIKFGKKYADFTGCPKDAGRIVELVQGYFDYENGLYTETQTAPSVWDEEQKDYDSIYHLFGNELENFMDCELLTQLNK